MKAGHEELIATVNDTTSVLSTVILWCISHWMYWMCSVCGRGVASNAPTVFVSTCICEKTVYVGESGVS